MLHIDWNKYPAMSGVIDFASIATHSQRGTYLRKPVLVIERHKPDGIYTARIEFRHFGILRNQLLDYGIPVPAYFVKKPCRLFLIVCFSYTYATTAALSFGLYNKPLMALCEGVEIGEGGSR